MAWQRLAMVLASLALLAAACGSTSADGDALRTSGDDLARLTPTRDTVSTRSATQADFTPATARRTLTHGHEVHTDGDGFADITYFDGTVTRLDGDSTLVLTRLDDGDPPSIRFNLTEGRAWNRVPALFGRAGSYQVITTAGTATALGGPRGSAFDVECLNPKLCIFRSLEGDVRVELVDGETITVRTGQTLTVELDVGVEGPDTDTVVDLLTDPFLGENEALDRDAGFDRIGPEPQPERPTTQAPTTRPVTTTTSDPDDEDDDEDDRPPGATAVRPSTTEAGDPGPTTSTSVTTTSTSTSTSTTSTTPPPPPDSYALTSSGRATSAAAPPGDFAPAIMAGTPVSAVSSWPDQTLEIDLDISCADATTCSVDRFTGARLTVFEATAGTGAPTIRRGLRFDASGDATGSSTARLEFTVASNPVTRSGSTLSGSLNGTVRCGGQAAPISFAWTIDADTDRMSGSVDYGVDRLVGATDACWLPDVTIG